MRKFSTIVLAAWLAALPLNALAATAELKRVQ